MENHLIVLICGDRKWTNGWVILRELMNFKPKSTTIIHGAAKGADSIAGDLAKLLGMHVIEVKANWNLYGKAAGPIRNRQMLALNPHIVLAFHKDIKNSKGTADMVKIAKKKGVYTEVINE